MYFPFTLLNEGASYVITMVMPKNGVFVLVGFLLQPIQKNASRFFKTSSIFVVASLEFKGGISLFINKTYLQLSIDEEDKKFLKDRAKELGFKSVSAFVMESAKHHFRVNLDMSAYKNLAKEINYIGKNINSLIRRI